MPFDLLRVGLLGLTLTCACVADAGQRRVPNRLTFPALLLGLALAGAQGGLPRLSLAVGGIGVASLALIAYAARALGAGDVKLLWAVGALTGPRFTSLTLLCTALAGGVLGLVWTMRRARTPLPYTLAITLGAALALWQRHGEIGL
jgi:prepilin peptidase CpaA